MTPDTAQIDAQRQALSDTYGAELCANYRPTQARRRYRKSVDHTLRHGVRSMMISAARRDDFDVPDLATLAALSDDLEQALSLAVANLRSQGHSWAVIGATLGTSRQAAFKRWATSVPADCV